MSNNIINIVLFMLLAFLLYTVCTLKNGTRTACKDTDHRPGASGFAEIELLNRPILSGRLNLCYSYYEGYLCY